MKKAPGWVRWPLAAVIMIVVSGPVAPVRAQTLPDPAWSVLRPEFEGYVCESRSSDPPPEPRTEAERARFEMRARYRSVLPAFFAVVGPDPARELVMPVDGLSVAQVANTFGAPRSGN